MPRAFMFGSITLPAIAWSQAVAAQPVASGRTIRAAGSAFPGWSAGRARLTLNQDKRRRFDSYPGSKRHQVSELTPASSDGFCVISLLPGAFASISRLPGATRSGLMRLSKCLTPAVGKMSVIWNGSRDESYRSLQEFLILQDVKRRAIGHFCFFFAPLPKRAKYCSRAPAE